MFTRLRPFAAAALALGAVAAVVFAVPVPAAAQADGPLVLYSGRSKSLVDPIIRQFTRETGVRVEVRYGNTAQLAVALTEEGERTPADVFWAQDAGALGAAVKRGLLAKLPDSILDSVPPAYENPEGLWVATSGRARTLAYSPQRVAEGDLPGSVFDLVGEKYRGRVGWAPTNASFQSFVTALRNAHGDEKAKQWLRAMKANGAKTYSNNTSIIQAIAAGEIDLGLPNHYYLLRFKTSDSKYPVEQTRFDPGDIGNMINVAGVGILKTSDQRPAAAEFIEYLLSPQAQQYFASHTFEYPVTDDVIPSDRLADPEALQTNAPRVDLDALDDLQGTLDLLREVGLL